MNKDNNSVFNIKPSPKILRWFFFISGIIATAAYRVIFLLDSYWIDVAWYTGTIGFVIYFWHRTNIETKRANIVNDFRLIEAIQKSDIENERQKALVYIVNTSLTSKARFNSAFIFIASLVVLLASLALDIYDLIY
ncbi:MAG: hypothetical protein FJZ43_03535 [Candidatus Staskawiczbacteria bacterium]|nr:hypothetical protein [Candidatus Staskawiczbacteria bacterium]